MFPTKVRLSGMAIGTQIGYAIGGFAPTAAAAIDSNGWAPVAIYVFGFSVMAAIAAATARETYRVPLQQLDGRVARRVTRPALKAETASAREPVLVRRDRERLTPTSSRQRS
jgi:hypothetical protein